MVPDLREQHFVTAPPSRYLMYRMRISTRVFRLERPSHFGRVPRTVHRPARKARSLVVECSGTLEKQVRAKYDQSPTTRELLS